MPDETFDVEEAREVVRCMLVDRDPVIRRAGAKFSHALDVVERLTARIVQIKGQVAIADERNWRDVIAIIGFIADGRCDAPSAAKED